LPGEGPEAIEVAMLHVAVELTRHHVTRPY
jgi:hypothetical protein